MKKLISTVLCASVLLSSGLSINAVAAATNAYKNFYVTYMSVPAVKSAVKYAKSQGVNHFFMWTLDQDASIKSPNSLIEAINAAAPNSDIALYYPNYAAYNNQRAIPGQSYLIKNNPDVTQKIARGNQLIYAFSETQVPSGKDVTGKPVGDRFIQTPGSYGSVYIFDPWSDLSAGDTFCGKGVQGVPVDGNGYNLICGFAFDNKINSTTGAYYQYANDGSYNYYGNLEAFSKLSVDGKDGKPVKKYLSVGGFGHNATFEAIFDPKAYGVTSVTQEQAMTNFVNSVVVLVKQFNLDGIDMDYENVSMSHQQSEAYLLLLQKLNAALKPLGKHISIPTISSPAYLDGSENNNTIGFAQGVLAKIANLSQVTYIDPMTYDFSGTFNYGDASNPGTSGFLTNVYNPSGQFAPKNYHFSIENVVNTVKKLGLPMSKIGVGIPAYGRALSNLPASTTDNSYLFSKLSPEVVIPAGDQDVKGCDSNITHWRQSSACQGMFSYQYLVDNVLNHGVTPVDQVDDVEGVINGSTAFGPSWAPAAAPHWTLTIVNHNAASGQVAVGSFNTAGYKATGTYVYTPKDSSALALIEGQKGLDASFKYWKQTISCGKVDMTSNIVITLSADPVPVCTVSTSSF